MEHGASYDNIRDVQAQLTKSEDWIIVTHPHIGNVSKRVHQRCWGER